jgi:hypothetical protein
MLRKWPSISFFIFLSVLSVSVQGCSSSSEPSDRPSQVPSDAIWAGGPDGGAYIRCSDPQAKRNKCVVYFANGAVWMAGDFVLQQSGQAATQNELQYSYADGNDIGLQGGKTLIPANKTMK